MKFYFTSFLAGAGPWETKRMIKIRLPLSYHQLGHDVVRAGFDVVAWHEAKMEASHGKYRDDRFFVAIFREPLVLLVQRYP